MRPVAVCRSAPLPPPLPPSRRIAPRPPSRRRRRHRAAAAIVPPPPSRRRCYRASASNRHVERHGTRLRRRVRDAGRQGGAEPDPSLVPSRMTGKRQGSRAWTTGLIPLPIARPRQRVSRVGAPSKGKARKKRTGAESHWRIQPFRLPAANGGSVSRGLRQRADGVELRDRAENRAELVWGRGTDPRSRRPRTERRQPLARLRPCSHTRQASRGPPCRHPRRRLRRERNRAREGRSTVRRGWGLARGRARAERSASSAVSGT